MLVAARRPPNRNARDAVAPGALRARGRGRGLADRSRRATAAWELSPLLVEHGHTPEDLADAFAGFSDAQVPIACEALGRGLASRGLLAGSSTAPRGSARSSRRCATRTWIRARCRSSTSPRGWRAPWCCRDEAGQHARGREDYGRTLPRVSVRGSELNQVWTNIIDNAWTPRAGPGPLTIRTSREGERVVVEIGDDGPGMPADVVEHVFDPFFTTKEPGKGTGLGMDISYRVIVTRHHGDVQVAVPARRHPLPGLPAPDRTRAVNPPHGESRVLPR